MKDEYDFTKAEQGKFYVPIDEIQMPIYLDQDVLQYLGQKCDFDADRIRNLINDWLRKDIEIAKRIS
jgi:hypothetical protein